MSRRNLTLGSLRELGTVGLVADGIIGPASWAKLMGN